MKKFFFFAAALVAAVTINAQTYDLTAMDIAESDITVTNGTITKNETKAYFEVKNTAGETVEMSIKQLPNVKFSYKNSAVKTAFKVYYNAEGKSGNGKIQMDGNQRDVTVSNLAIGTIVTLIVCSKGDTGAQFANSEKGDAFTGCVAVDPSAVGIGTALPGKTAEAGNTYDIKVQAAASTITIRETAGGYILKSLTIGGGTAIDNTAVEAKATKYMENGALVIVKNGVKYNALGAVIE